MERISTHDYVGKLSDEHQKECEYTRNKFKDLEDFLNGLASIGNGSFSDRCYSIAKTKLEEASMYIIKGIAFEGKLVK